MNISFFANVSQKIKLFRLHLNTLANISLNTRFLSPIVASEPRPLREIRFADIITPLFAYGHAFLAMN